MRPFLVICTYVLSLLAIAGLGFSGYMVITVVSKMERFNGETIGLLCVITILPTILGAIALGAVANVLAINHSREEQAQWAAHTVRALEALRGAPPAGGPSAPYAGRV